MNLSEYLELFKKQLFEHDLLGENSLVVVLNSGGKDSCAMSYLFREYAKEKLGLRLEYLNIVFPQMVFGSSTEEISDKIRGISEVFNPFKSVIPKTSYDKLGKTDNPCLLCKQVRRKAIAKIIASKEEENIIIATGHNNYDLLAYFIELFSISPNELVKRGLDYENLNSISIKDSDLEHFSRFFPKLELNSGITLIKPMLVFNRLEINDILKKAGVPTLICNCPYASHRPKRNLFRLLRKAPLERVKELVTHNTYKNMISVLREKVQNFDKAFEEVKQKDYSELLL